MTDVVQNKILIELEAEILGKIDLLIENEIYSDRISFLKTAINQLLTLHSDTINDFKVKNDFVIGYVHYSHKDLEKIVADGKKLNIRVIGGISFANDVSPELATSAIDKINLAGILRAPPAIKTILGPKRYTLLGKKRSYFLPSPDTDVESWNEDKEEDK